MFKYVKQLTSLVAMVAVLFAFTTETMAAKKSKTLKNTQKKGFVRCGVSQGLPGFSNADAAGNWTGVDVDVCRAVAAAVLGDANKVKFTPLSAKERFTALTSGEIDILSRNTTWTLSRDADIGLNIRWSKLLRWPRFHGKKRLRNYFYEPIQKWNFSMY